MKYPVKMPDQDVAFLFGLAFVVLAFLLKAGLFNGRFKKSDQITTLQHFAEFPIDGTMAAMPLLVIGAAANFSEDPNVVTVLPAALLAVVLQIFFFKDIRLRTISPGTTGDGWAIPTWIFLSYSGFLWAGFTAFQMAREVLA